MKRVLDGALRRLGLVRTAVAAAQTVDALYLSNLGRTPDVQERAERAGALRKGQLSPSTLIDGLRESAEGQARLRDAALPIFVREGYVAPQAHFERLVEIGFLAVFGRKPEAEALSAYEGALRSGALSMDAFVGELLGTQEAADRILSKGYLNQEGHLAQLIDAVFLAALGRRAEDEARAAFAASLRAEDLTVESFIAEILGTQEAADRIVSAGYVNRPSQLRGLIDAIFRTALGRYDQAAAEAFASAVEKGGHTLDRVIDELSTCSEAKQRAFDLVEPILKDRGYTFVDEHYAEIVDTMFRSIIGRPADDAGRETFVGDLVSGRLTVETAIERLMNSDEVRLRVRYVGLPDVLEGIYRTIMGAPETDPVLRSLIRSAASQSTFETIKNMSLSAEARHYIMRPILKAHSQQFLSAASAASAAGATPV